MARKKRDESPVDEGPVTDQPFAQLGHLRDQLPAGEKAVAEEPAEPAGAEPAAAPRRAVVRYQRKGRGGKAVTLIEKLELPPAGLEAWARELKGQLGVGGGVEGEAIALQGDCRDRAAEALVRRGVTSVRRG